MSDKSAEIKNRMNELLKDPKHQPVSTTGPSKTRELKQIILILKALVASNNYDGLRKFFSSEVNETVDYTDLSGTACKTGTFFSFEQLPTHLTLKSKLTTTYDVLSFADNVALAKLRACLICVGERIKSTEMMDALAEIGCTWVMIMDNVLRGSDLTLVDHLHKRLTRESCEKNMLIWLNDANCTPEAEYNTDTVKYCIKGYKCEQALLQGMSKNTTIKEQDSEVMEKFAI